MTLESATYVMSVAAIVISVLSVAYMVRCDRREARWAKEKATWQENR